MSVAPLSESFAGDAPAAPAATLRVTVRYFAALREALGPSETLEVPASLSVGDLRRLLVARGGAHAELLAADRPVRCALAQRMVDDTAALQPGAEVAFFPPVTGG